MDIQSTRIYAFIPYKIMVDIIIYMQKLYAKMTVCDDTQNLFLQLLLEYYDANLRIEDSVKNKIRGAGKISLLKNVLNDHAFLAISIEWKNLEHSFVLINTETETYIVDSYAVIRCVSYRKFDFDKLTNLISLDDWNELFLSNEKNLRIDDDRYNIYYAYYSLNYA